MHDCSWWCHPPIAVHLPPRNSQLVPAFSVGNVVSFSSGTTAACARLPLVGGGLLGTWLHFASHPHAFPYDLPIVHLEITHEHISYTNSVCKGQAGPSSSPPEETQTYCQGQSVSLQPGWPEDRPRVLCSGAQTTSVATVSLCAVSFTVSSQGAHFWGEKSRALWWDQPCPATTYKVILQTLHHYCTQWLLSCCRSSHAVSVPRSASLFLGEDRKSVAE